MQMHDLYNTTALTLLKKNIKLMLTFDKNMNVCKSLKKWTTEDLGEAFVRK